MAELKFSSHFRSEEMVVPRNLNDFTSSTTSPAIVGGTRGVFFFLLVVSGSAPSDDSKVNIFGFFVVVFGYEVMNPYVVHKSSLRFCTLIPSHTEFNKQAMDHLKCKSMIHISFLNPKALTH